MLERDVLDGSMRLEQSAKVVLANLNQRKCYAVVKVRDIDLVRLLDLVFSSLSSLSVLIHYASFKILWC